ncbi:MAG: hypothetical protein IT373_25030 [Polyangiaceae bacterium]|nr:hypothetical protein [Polyangiaceae bacterium]
MRTLALTPCLAVAPLALVALVALGCQGTVTAESATQTTSTSTSSGPTTSPLSITIENPSAATVFVLAGHDWPFTIWTAGAPHALTTNCSCELCSSAGACTVSDWLTTVVALPPGQSLTLADDFSSYTELPVVAESCPWAADWATCGQPSAFAAGNHEVRVPYDGEPAMLAQSVHPAGYTQWGLEVWVSPYMFAAVDLAQTATETLTVGAGTATAVVTIGG